MFCDTHIGLKQVFSLLWAITVTHCKDLNPVTTVLFESHWGLMAVLHSTNMGSGKEIVTLTLIVSEVSNTFRATRRPQFWGAIAMVQPGETAVVILRAPVP